MISLELADANDNLTRSNAELAQFAYIASHDLQEPLRKISIFSQLLEQSLGDNVNEKTTGYLTKINHSSSRMSRLIKDVLTYSRLSKEQEVFELVDLNLVIERAREDYELLIEQKEAVIYCSGLPVIAAIPLQMAQLFGNLLGNALKFTRHDVQPLISITATQFEENDIVYFKITIADNGIGLKAEYAEQIFQIFQRLHRKSEYEGTGIGLAMCKKIALNHHGDINGEGSSENGAVINILLPEKQL